MRRSAQRGRPIRRSFRHRQLGRAMVFALLGGVVASGCAGSAGPAPILIGEALPLSGPLAAGAADERLGLEIARDLANSDGGIGGRPIELVAADLHSSAAAAGVVDGLHARGVAAILGAYSSALSEPASVAAAEDGVVWWETGAEVDSLTSRGLPAVFRVGATGGTLGSNSGRFAVEQLAPRLGMAPSSVRVALVVADDPYAHSVADAASATVRAAGMAVVATLPYDPVDPDFAPVLGSLRTARPDVLILSSHVPDGVAFRHAMLADGLRVGALIGSTMAECGPDFGFSLGADAVGVFASDRPGDGFDPTLLPPAGQALYQRFAEQWRSRTEGRTPNQPTEEGLAGFTSAWVLFHHVLPAAAGAGRLDSGSIIARARTLDLPEGSLANGAGVRFATTGDRMGQNLRAAAVIWQWQGVRHSVVVWPAAYATGRVGLVPLPR